MSLSAMLDTHDEGALAALASAGLVRRATRDLEAGKADIIARHDTEARVLADGFEVTIPAEGPSAATCGCPATGLCRHKLLAILALRATAGPSAPRQSASDDLALLTEEALRKFAGADWEKAVRQAQISTAATLAEDGANLSVILPDAPKPVVFLAGQGLAGAVYKGPKTAKRRVVTAAALVVRLKAGIQSLDELTDVEVTMLTLDTLKLIRDAVIELVQAVLGGGSTIAEEHIFDLAISARAQAAPRVTALLRLLARQARLARDHHFAYDDARFLSDASLVYALTLALEARPGDPELTGSLRRTYVDGQPLNLTIVGAVNWAADSGARGTRIHAIDAKTGQWYATGQARGAGMDPGFAPGNVYSGPLWGVGLVADLVGKSLTLANPRVSEDHQIAWESGLAKPLDAPLHAVLQNSDITHRIWPSARADIAARLPSGLKWAGASVPVLLAPRRLAGARFDDIAQTYVLDAIDSLAQTLPLTLPASRAEDVDWLKRNERALSGLLCECTVAGLELTIVPVTAYLETKDGLQAIDLTFHDPARRMSAQSIAGKIEGFLIGSFASPPVPPPPDPLRSTSLNAFDAIAEALRFGSAATLSQTRDNARELGLNSLAAALASFEQSKSAADALRASYIAGETLKSAL